MKQDIVSLRRKKDFDLVFQQGRKYDSPLFRLIVRRTTIPHIRLAIVVAKSVDKRAVMRNTIRRRIREWIRKSHEHTGLIGRDIVFLVKKDITYASKTLLYKELEKEIKKI